MMTKLSESLTFTVALSSSAHRLAQQFRGQQSNPQKAKQVYLNTLAVFAVKFYLRCMGIETDWQTSQSWSPVMQSLMNVADLNVVGLGKLECRPVLPETQIVYIPPEVWSDRVGYVAVQLDSSLEKATLLGFTKTASTDELPLSQLQSLADLLEHLSQIQQPIHVNESATSPVGMVNLSRWFDNLFEMGWQSLEALLGTDSTSLALSLRGDAPLSKVTAKRAKLIDLGVQLQGQSVALLVAITQEAEGKVGILVQMHPMGGQTYLPPNLRLSLLSESEEVFQEVQSRSQDNYIQLRRFRGLPGEYFNVQVALGDAQRTETFVI